MSPIPRYMRHLTRRNERPVGGRVAGARNGRQVLSGKLQRRSSRSWWKSPDVLAVVAVELVFTVGFGWFLVDLQDQREDNRTERALATEERQAERAEVLANVAYIREVTAEDKPKDFRYLNLRGANISGMDLGCDVVLGIDADGDLKFNPKKRDSCADFTGTDFTGADLRGVDITGANLDQVVFRPQRMESISAVGATITGRVDLDIWGGDLRGALVDGFGKGSISLELTQADFAVFSAGTVQADADTSIHASDFYNSEPKVRSDERCPAQWLSCRSDIYGSEHVPLEVERIYYQLLGCNVTDRRYEETTLIYLAVDCRNADSVKGAM